MRAVLVVIVAGAVGGCMTASGGPNAGATAPPTGAWKVNRRADPVTGSAVDAWVASTRVSSRTKLFPDPAGVQFLCYKSEPMVRLRFAEKVGANRSTSFAYRVDDASARAPSVRILQDHRTIVIEDRQDVATFVKDVSAAAALHVSVESLTVVGKTTATFPVGGAPAAIEAAFADCPLDGKAKTSAAR